MTFAETKQYYEMLQTVRGIEPGLDSIRRLLNRLGDPQERIPVIQVAGTNGKGSVTTMLASILSAAGYRTASFHSPVVFQFGEQFRIDGKQVPAERIASAFTIVRSCCDQLCEEGFAQPTAFEVETAAAFVCFSMEQADAAVIETGMGGALDATNVVKRPLLSVLTSIGMDHGQFLGGTLSEVAAAKAGIIKDYCPCVTVKQAEEVMKVVENRCHEMGSQIRVADPDLAENVQETKAGISFVYQGMPLQLPLHGLYQVENAVCAVEAAHMLNFCYGNGSPGDFYHSSSRAENGGPDNSCYGSSRAGSSGPNIFSRGSTWAGSGRGSCADPDAGDTWTDPGSELQIRISNDPIQRGLRDISWPGRMELLKEKPQVYIDGAHNPAAARQLRRSWDVIRQQVKNGNVAYLMGVLADKDYGQIADLMFRPGERIFTVTPDNRRALPAEELARVLNGKGCLATACTGVSEALEQASEAVGEDGCILAFGSLSYLAEVRRCCGITQDIQARQA